MNALEQTGNTFQPPDISLPQTHIMTLMPGETNARSVMKNIAIVYANIAPRVKQHQTIEIFLGEPMTADKTRREGLVETIQGQDVVIDEKYPVRLRHGKVVVVDESARQERSIGEIIQTASQQGQHVYVVRINPDSSMRLNKDDPSADIQPRSTDYVPPNRRWIPVHGYTYGGKDIADLSEVTRQRVLKKKGLDKEEILIFELARQHKSYQQIAQETSIPRGSLPGRIEKIRDKLR
jgi:hypothetical protein